MLLRSPIAAVALAAALLAGAAARADDLSKYPNLNGQWAGVGADQGAPWDPGKPPGAAQEAPLTPEYQAVFQAMLAKRKERGIEALGCLPPGMPRAMIMYQPMDIVVVPDTTFMMITHMNEFRRIYTDGRRWPKDDEIEPSFSGYSIGEWIDESKDGRYGVLAVETRGLKGPRTFDASGLPLHKDDQTVVKERIYLDRNDANLLHDEVTVVDHALTRPWTVTRSYRRQQNPAWSEFVCTDTQQVQLGDEIYRINDEGYLTPTRPGQPPPDMTYFKKR